MITKISQLVKNLSEKKFIKNFSVLATGTILSQLLYFLGIPLLTRVYRSEDFANLSIYLAILSIVQPLSSGRYEVAIFLSRIKKEQEKLFFISILVAIFVSIIIFFFLSISNYFGKFENLSNIHNYYFLLPIGILFASINNNFRFYYNRLAENYKLLSYSIVSQSFFNIAIALILGLISKSLNGMIISFICAQLISILILNKKKLITLKSLKKNINIKILKVALIFREFPLFNAPATILDNLTISLPIFFLANSYSLEVVGYYELVSKISGASMGVFSKSFAPINLKKVSELNSSKEELEKYFKKVSRSLLKIFIVPTFLISYFSPKIFYYVFGSEWEVAGEFFRILFPSFVFKYSVVSLNNLAAIGHNKLSSLWKIISLILTFSCLSFFSGKLDIYYLLIIITFMDILIYLILYLFIFYGIKNPTLLKDK